MVRRAGILVLTLAASGCGEGVLLEPPPGLAELHTADSYAHAAVRPLAWQRVEVRGGFWGPVRDRSRDRSVPDALRKLEQAGAVHNFRIVAAGTDEEHAGGPNTDEFVYKLLEASGLYAAESEEIRSLHAELAEVILAAQAADGYLNTFYANPLQLARGQERFQPTNRFELYNFAHFTQAAIANYYATGGRSLLEAAKRFADLLVASFADPADLPYELYRGPAHLRYEHPNHELAMVELYRVTGEDRYLEFVRQTLQEYGFFGPQFDEIQGHAVQETLLQAGAADLFLETGDAAVWEVVERLWQDAHERKRYVTGGVGSTSQSEAYGAAFQLPNDTAYAETCAAISLVLWNHRMLLATGDPRFAGAMERSLYNSVLSGYALDGTHYFYCNPLAWDPDDPKRDGVRQPWFPTACCPPNVHRLLAALPAYVYTADEDSVQVNLFVESTVTHRFWDGVVLRLQQSTEYPWRGTVSLRLGLSADTRFELALRIPEWADGARVSINDDPVRGRPEAGRYLRLGGPGGWWKDGDTVELELPLVARLLPGDERVQSQRDRVAVLRGPLVYAFEAADNRGIDLQSVLLLPQDAISDLWEPDLLGGVVSLNLAAEAPGDAGGTPVEVKAVPYYTWANREPGTMRVWLEIGRPSAIPAR